MASDGSRVANALNGQGSHDSDYLASPNSLISSIDSSTQSNRGYLTTNGLHSPAASKQSASHNSKQSLQQPSSAISRTAEMAGAKENGHQEEDLWSSILNSVKSSRAVPVKSVIILGEPRTGKSTILSQLASSSLSSFGSLQHSRGEDTSAGEASSSEKLEGSSDLGLGYTYFDVGDEDGEDVIARVGVYQASSSNPAHLSLLPFAISSPADALTSTSKQTGDNQASGSRVSKSSGEATGKGGLVDTKPRPSIEALRDSIFLIVLDWETPWTFLSQLVEWLDVVREIVEEAANTSKGSWSRERVVWEGMKESLEASIRTYSDPSGHIGAVGTNLDEGDEAGETSIASAIVPVSNPASTDTDEGAPLPEGCLTHNLGVPLVVVCTKADTITQLERDRNFKEEKFDYVQQVLRTICLKYGAGLFFTSQTKPPSFEVLRSYVLHQLFSRSSHGTTGTAFTFPYRASTVERDVLLVPAGWDTFGKIRALRDGFDCAGMANGWEWDAQVERIRRNQSLPKGSRQAEEVAEQQLDRRSLPGLIEGDRSGVESTIKLYEAIVEDWDANAAPLTVNQNKVKEPDEQAFLLQHFNNLQREPDTRSKLSRQSSSSAVVLGQTVDVNRSVVGPVGSSSLSLPSVERAMQERQSNDEGRSGKPSSSSKKEVQSNRDRERDRDRDREGGRSTPVHRSAISSALQSPSLGSSDKGGGSRPTSPLGSGQGGAQTPKQSEVLHSFFQSLLKEKGPGGATGTNRSSASRGNATSERKGAQQ